VNVLNQTLNPQTTGNPLSGLTLAGFASALREGHLTAENVTSDYLSRISALDPSLGAFEEVRAAKALQDAREIDRRLSAGEDLGVLMGVPVAVKDIFAVDGTEIHAGSRMRVDDLVGPEGSFVRRLRDLGCIVIGKTKTTEFAFSPSGINAVRGTPRNPHDDVSFRIPGGSSSGSAVAVAAGMCPVSVGSDTGGSVRIPAALNGLVGLKTSVGLWKTDGVFSLSTTFDSIGLFARSVADIAFAFAAVEAREPIAGRTSPEGLRLGVPRQYFFDELNAEVANAFGAAAARLEDARVNLVAIDLPEAEERVPLIGRVLAYEVIQSCGRERIIAALPDMDPLVRQRVEAGLSISPAEHATMVERHQAVEAAVATRLDTLDGWICPTVPCPAPALADCGVGEEQAPLNLRLTQNTQPGNLFGQCGVSLPLPTQGMPVALQLCANRGRDHNVIAVAAAIEPVVCGRT
jgi:aspartyl-tRNA(Asn)/glutamyl-tRNA(Gln) amidotransferase subunit A